MSIYKCGICEDYKDADISGCYENPFDKFSSMCEDCQERLGCYHCGEVKTDTKYCKITDQYFCESCV